MKALKGTEQKLLFFYCTTLFVNADKAYKDMPFSDN